jgi:hypothetical protein
VLGTQETFCIVIAGLLERDSFDLFLPKFDKSWVIHLRETCCCSTNLCTWRPNTVYKDRSVHRHQSSSSIASSRERGDRLEVLQAPASFGCERICRSAAKLSPGRSQGDAPVKGKEDRGKRGTRGSPTTTQLGGYARWFCRLR